MIGPNNPNRLLFVTALAALSSARVQAYSTDVAPVPGRVRSFLLQCSNLVRPPGNGLRLLTLTRLIDVFSVHASVDEAAGDAGRSRRAAATVSGLPTILAVT
jgi:hypothetical protein